MKELLNSLWEEKKNNLLVSISLTYENGILSFYCRFMSGQQECNYFCNKSGVRLLLQDIGPFT